MASIYANFRSIDKPHSYPVASPTNWPSWTSPHQNTITIGENFTGRTVTWSCENAIRRTISISATEGTHLCATLTHFPPIYADGVSDHVDLMQKALSPSSQKTATLCVANGKFVTMTTPENDHLQCAIPKKQTEFPWLLNPNVSALFPLPAGLVVEVMSSYTLPQSSSYEQLQTPQRAYYYLAQQLDEMSVVSLPSHDHRVVFSTPDIPILVTCNDQGFIVWRTQVERTPTTFTDSLSLFSPTPEPTDSPIASLVASATNHKNGLEFVNEPDQEEEPDVIPRQTKLVLEKLFDAPLNSNDNISAFIAHDISGDPVLCVLSNGSFYGLEIAIEGNNITSVSQGFRIPDVATAASILSIRRPQSCLDILVQHQSGGMSLFAGKNRLCSVELEPLPRNTFPSQKLATLDSFLISKAVGTEFHLCHHNGMSFRYSLHSTCFLSPLVNSCISAISYQLHYSNPRRITAFYHDLLTTRSRYETSNSLADDNADREWSIFTEMLLYTMSGTGSSRSLNNDVMDCDTENENIENQKTSDEEWETLLKSGYHHTYGMSKLPGPQMPLQSTYNSSGDGLRELKVTNIDTLRNILRALHLLYEDYKTDSLGHKNLKSLAILNSQLAKLTSVQSYHDYYRRDFSDIIIDMESTSPRVSPQQGEDIPSIFDHLANLLQTSGKNTSPFFPKWMLLANTQESCSSLHSSWRTRSPFYLSRRIVHYYEYLSNSDNMLEPEQSRAYALLTAMARDKFTRADLDALPFGISIPLRDSLWICRQAPQDNWTYNEFDLIGREDLFNYDELNTKLKNNTGENSTEIAQSKTLLQIQAAASFAPIENNNSIIQSETGDKSTANDGSEVKDSHRGEDGCEMNEALHNLRFCEDKRIDEVRRVLRSTDPTLLTQTTNTERDTNGESDLAEDLKRKLEVLLRKRYAAPVGRGAFTLRTYAPSDPTKTLPIPSICTNGKLVDSECNLSITCPETGRFHWGEFHNGVAAGLRIIAADNNRESDTSQILTRSWIVNHKPADISDSASHAGMLFALGLGGYLPALKKTDYYRYLVPRHDLTSIGLMLGLSAGNIGSMNENITKMLCLHIRYFNKTGFSVPEFHVSINVQSAAILGLGLLHQGSCENLIIEGLFAELSRRPKPGDAIDNRENLALSAGFSIGFLCLGHGMAAFDAADGRHVDRLLFFANGGSGKTVDIASQNGDLRTDVLSSYDRIHNSNQHSEASRVMEGPFVNSDVVSRGALVALGLTFLKTNNQRIADRIVLPETSYGLDRSHPDHVFLKVLARCLIMWDDITPTTEWIINTIPALLRPVSDKNVSDPFDILGRIGVGISFSDTEMDITGILQARAFAVAGACTAIALKYAGTLDTDVVILLSKACEAFEKALLSQEKDASIMDWTCMSCMCAVALALSIVAAGSGSLSVFKLLRRLRKRKGKATSEGRFGSHMAIHMAIGFLFLGGGCQTFGSSYMAIAGLLCAIYPQFPRDINDNQYHMQPLRHLYVLAIEPRCLDTRDVNTGNSCCVDIELKLIDGSKKRMRAPCILPNASNIKEIGIVSERYLYNTMKVNSPMTGKGWYSNNQHQIIYVKRRTGHLPYKMDPKGSKGILARSLHGLQVSSTGPNESFEYINHLVRAFRADPEVLAFVRYFCTPSLQISHSNDHSVDTLENVRHYAKILYECLSMDKQEAIKMYIDAERARDCIASHNGSPSTIGSLTLLDAYIHSDFVSSSPLVRPEFLKKIIDDARKCVDLPQTREDFIQYVRSSGKRWPELGSSTRNTNATNYSQNFSTYLRLYSFPQLERLTEFSRCLRRIKRKAKHNEIWYEIAENISSSVTPTAIEAFFRAITI